MGWFAVRTVYRWGQKDDGMTVFEERVVVFEAESSNAAFAKAEAESKVYADGDDIEIVGTRESYEQDGEKLIDGYEVWSQLFESDESKESFYKQRYERFDYHPPT